MRSTRELAIASDLPVPNINLNWSVIRSQGKRLPTRTTGNSLTSVRWWLSWRGVAAGSAIVFMIACVGLLITTQTLFGTMGEDRNYNDTSGEDVRSFVTAVDTEESDTRPPQGSSRAGMGLEPFVNSNSGLALDRDVDMTLRAKEPMKLADSVRELVAENGGYVVQLYRESDTSDYLTMEVKIPSGSLDQVVQKIRGLGELTSIRESTNDISGQMINYGALLAESRDYLARLEKLKEEGSKDSSLESLQKLEQELRNTRREVEQYDRTLKSLNARVAFATLSLDVFRADAEGDEVSGIFEEAWNAGVYALIQVLAFLVKALLATLPISVALTILLLIQKRRANAKNE